MPSRPPAATPTPPRSWPWLAALAALVAAIYANTLTAPFLFDDAGAVVDNASIRRLATAFSPPADGSTTTGRPVLNFTFALTHALGGGAPWAHHAGNLVLHAAAALALFGVARRTLAGPVLGPRWSASAAPVAFALAALWAAHPLLTESVTGIAQRSEVLAGALLLATVYAFLRGWRTVSVIACAVGMGAKEVMAVAPLLVLLHDRTFVAGSFAAAWRERRGYYAALGGTWLPLLFLVAGGGGTRGISAGLGLGVSPWHYLLTQAEALVTYLRLAIFPYPLVLDYGTAVVTSVGEVWWQGLLVLALLCATVWALFRRPVAGYLGAWFFLILAPSSSVIPLVAQTIAEHRMYLPLAAVVAGVVAALHQRLGARAWPVLAALGVAAAVGTVLRNEDYRSVRGIWADTVAHRPQSARARVNLGVELQRAGDVAGATEQFAEAARLQPDYVTAHYSWGAALLAQGRVAEAVERLQRAVALAPAHADAHLALGNALVQAGRPADAVAAYQRSLELRPAADGYYNLGQTLAGLGRSGEAEAALRRAIALDPNLAVAQRRLGLLLARGGRVAEAAECFAAAIRADPADADSRANLGNVRLLQGRVTEAISLYEDALRLRPNDARTREALAVARQSQR